MKKTGKIVSLMLALVMTVGIFAGCGGKDIEKTGGKYTYWVNLDSKAGQTLTSYSELLMYQEISKATGIDVEFIHPSAGSTGTEAFQILLSSGDYPDMIEYFWDKYAGGPDQAIEDGVIISLNDYIKDYAPNYYDYMEGEKGKENGGRYKVQSMTSKGNYYGFKNMNIGSYRGFNGLYVRKDMLDSWGLDVPATIDDWDVLFKTAKENGFKYPFTCKSDFFVVDGANAFANGWNINGCFYLEDDTVKFGPFEARYSDYLAKMQEWFKAGYIDVDFVTNTNVELEGAMTNGTSMATFGYVGSGIGKLVPAMAQKDPSYKLVACPYPVMKEGDVYWFQEVQPESADPTIAISTQCGIDNEDRYKEAISWCDYIYGEEGNLLKCFGIEGETYTVETDENGEKHYVYTDTIKDHEKIGAHSVEAALYHFMRPANSPGLNQHPDYLMGFYPYQEQLDALELWNTHVDEAKKHKLPPLQYTGDEAAKRAELEANHRKDIDALINSTIIGKTPADSFNAEVTKIKNAGYGELLKIQQTAYDRYLKALK